MKPVDREDWVLTSVFEAHERVTDYPGLSEERISGQSGGCDFPQASVVKQAAVLGMRKSDSWIFYAIYSDGTKVRDKFNTELWAGSAQRTHPMMLILAQR